LRSVLWAVTIADGSVREIYSTTNNTIGRPRWLPDGSGLLAALGNAEEVFRGQLWFIPYPKGDIRRLTNDLMDYQLCCLDLTQDGKTLVDTELTTASELWVAPAGDISKAKQITSKDSTVRRFSWKAQGGFVFAGADGNLYAVNPDGSARMLLTPNDRGNQDPSVCGGGHFIVYSAFQEQKLGIWRMDTDGSNRIRIADETVAQNPQCSPDGKWVVYLRGPAWIPVRVAITGTEQPLVLTQDVVLDSLEISPDGSRIMYVAYVTPDSQVAGPAPSAASRPNQLKVIPFSGGAPMHQFDWPASATNPRWSLGGDAVDYVLARNGVSNVWRQKLNGGPPKQITNFQSGLIFDFHWSHDGKQLALARGSTSSDVILISNFR
jgi:Tol biopolymer transport system component